MKKIISLVIAVITVVGLFAGCGSSKGDTLKVAVSPDFSPMEFVDPNKSGQDRFIGFDISLAKYLAEEMGKELEIMPMSFEACQTAVYTGTVDMSLSGFSWTEERAQNYNLSDTYHAGDNEENQVLITLAGNEGKFLTPDDLNGVKIGAQTASLQESLCKSQLPGCEIVTIGDLGTALLQLKKGDFDCLAVADGNGDAIIANNPDIIKSGFQFEIDPQYTDNLVLLKKGNDELTATVNELLAKAKAAGLYETWYAEAEELAGIGIEESYTDPVATEAE